MKLRWGKYLGFASNDPPFTSTNKGATLVATVNRDWTDNDNDKVVDCDLLNNAAQGPATGQVDTCAAVIGNDANFGQAGAATIVDPELLKGWGVRTHDYQTEITLQQEIVPRVSAEVSYIHRTFHGFFVTNDLGRNYQTDWVNYTITAPTDPRLPGGGDYPITIYLREHHGGDAELPDAVRAPTATDGKERETFYDGVNFNVNARMRNGLFVSIGTQTGRRVDDRCHVVDNYNNAVRDPDGPNPRDCRDVDPWETTVRGLGSYTIPKVDVLVSATVRSQPPLAAAANWQVPNTTVRDASRRHAAAGAARDRQFDDRPDRQRPPIFAREPPHAGGHALREGVPLWPDADRRRRGPLEPVQHELRDRLRGHVHGRQRHRWRHAGRPSTRRGSCA